MPRPSGRSNWRGWVLGQAVTAAVVLAIVAGFVWLGPGLPSRGDERHRIPAAFVQDDGELASHAIVGLWWMIDEYADPLGDEIAIFHADGTFVEHGAGIVYFGVWRPIDDRTVEVAFFTGHLNSVDEPFVPGRIEMHMEVTMNEAGDAFSGAYMPTYIGANGTVHFTGISFPIDGTRLGFDTLTNTDPATPASAP